MELVFCALGIVIGGVVTVFLYNAFDWWWQRQREKNKRKIKELNQFLLAWWRDDETHWILDAMVNELSRKRKHWEEEDQENGMGLRSADRAKPHLH